MMFLSGVYIPLDAAPSYVQAISRVLPLTYFSDGLRAALVLQDYHTATNYLIVTSILAVIFIAVGSVVTKWKER
jgi:ABC-2 type transport system permease protein